MNTQFPPVVMPLLAAATAVSTGTAYRNAMAAKTIQADGTTTAGAGAAAIDYQGSNDNTNWDTIGTISLTLATTTSSDSFVSNDRYAFIRGKVTSISGTGASVNLRAVQ